jgi:hypothetical protein
VQRTAAIAHRGARVMRPSARAEPADDADAVVESCRQKSVELLRTNLSPQGVLAATHGARDRHGGDARQRP